MKKRNYNYCVWLVQNGRKCACRLFVRKDAAERCCLKFREAYPESGIEILF